MNLTSLIDWLDGHINYERSGPGDRSSSVHDPVQRMLHMRKLLDLMDNPQTAVPDYVHITGTNGKTSTVRMVTGLMLAYGLRTGTYTSPHLQTINERIAVNDEPIGDSELGDILEAIRLLEGMLDDDERPTYFELLTAAGLRHFTDAPVDVAVVEVGVGGTFDATNVIDARVAVVTNIGHDHHNYLGSQLSDVAEQKAGIVKPHSTLVTGERNPEILEVLAKAPAPDMVVLDRDFSVVSNRLAVGGRLIDVRTPFDHYEDVFVSAHGAHQGVNAAVAIAAVETFFGKAIPRDVVRDGLGTVTTPGRMEIVNRNPLMLLDGAHNEHAASTLAVALDEELSATPGRVIVVGMLEPHEPAEFLAALGAGRARLVIACTAPSPRAVPASRIAEAARGLGAPVVTIDDVSAAVDEAKAAAGEQDMVIVTGSLYVVGAARKSLA